MRKAISTVLIVFATFMAAASVVRAGDREVGSVFCDGPAPAYFMGVMPSGTDALTTLMTWAMEYQKQGGVVLDGEDALGGFGWSEDWRIYGIWVDPTEDHSTAHPCLATFFRGATVECHYFVVRKESAEGCESCKE